MKRRKHKAKAGPKLVIMCGRCDLVDVTDDDPEMECVCESCWDGIFKANRADYKSKFRLNGKPR